MRSRNNLWMGLAALVGLLIIGCTVTPRVVSDGEASFDGNTQNSGLIGFDTNGVAILTAHAAERYNGLMSRYGTNWSPAVRPGDGLVATETNTWLMDRQHLFYFATANRWRAAGR